MGAWGYKPFQNDDAIGWLVELRHSGRNAILRTLKKAASRERYLEAPDACAAVAAASVVASMLDCSFRDLPNDAKEWVILNRQKIPPNSATLRLASAGLERIVRDSELKELWEESSTSLSKWLKTTRQINVRLRPNNRKKEPLSSKLIASIEKKRFHWAEGAVVKIPIGDRWFGFARLLRFPKMAFYGFRTRSSQVSAEEIVIKKRLFTIAVGARSGFQSDGWQIIGIIPLEPELQKLPLSFKQDQITGRLTLYDPSDWRNERPATFKQCLKLERCAVWNPHHVMDRLRNHFAGRKCKWVESLKPKR